MAFVTQTKLKKMKLASKQELMDVEESVQKPKKKDLDFAMTSRWYALKSHPEQHNLVYSKARFRMACAGRRSGKTERAKRYLVAEAINFSKYSDGRFVALSPTCQQTDDIYWDDIKALIPDWALDGPRFRAIRESFPKTVKLWNGSKIILYGMDKPHRVEGAPIDGAIADEFADWKPGSWERSLRPALSTPGRPGWCWFVGKPKGRNHFWELWNKANKDKTGRWSTHHWSAEDILDEEEIQSLRDDLDPLSYAQEVRADFVNFEGRAYYDFDRGLHAGDNLRYDPRDDLIFAFDFNRAPGVCAILQEMEYKGTQRNVADDITGCIGEVFIKQNSNTPRVCHKIIADWSKHRGKVLCYGDATGGIQKTQSTEGSDWDLIEKILRPVFRDRMTIMVNRSNPPERIRVNSMNVRIKNTSGKVHFLVDPDKAPHVVDDFEGTCVIEGGAGEIDKDPKRFPTITHLSDGIGYYVHQKYPMAGANTIVENW